MLFGFEPFEAFSHDAQALNVEEDESRLPIRWLAAAQVASRLSQSTRAERKSLLKIWVTEVKAAQREPDGVWAALAVPGIEVTDLASAADTLTTIARAALDGGALNLAYCISMSVRVALLETGPVQQRARAAFVQAECLHALQLMEQTQDTYEAAHEDAVRAGDRNLEATIVTRLEHLRKGPGVGDGGAAMSEH